MKNKQQLLEMNEEINMLKFQKYITSIKLKEVFIKYLLHENLVIQRGTSVVSVVIDIWEYGETIVNKNFS